MGKSLTPPNPETPADGFDDVVESLKKMRQHLGEDAGDAMSKTAVALAHAAADLAQDARAKSKTLASRAGQEICEHPAATAALAAAAVALIGVAIAAKRAHDDPASPA